VAQKSPVFEDDIPRVTIGRMKYAFWRFYTPYHSFFRDRVVEWGIASPRQYQDQYGRQPYLLGTIAPHLSIKEFISLLVARGYGNHFVAWRDEGELASLRYAENFTHQYHVRVFNDGQVRAHYEYTPECYPIAHMRGVDFEHRREFFLNHLGDTIVPSQEQG
jgi:hypothetical protein